MTSQNPTGAVEGFFRKKRTEAEERGRADLSSRIAALQSEISHVTVQPDKCLELARCHAALRDHTSALDVLRAAAARFPLSGEVHYALLRLLQKSGLDDEALDAGKRACELVPSDFTLRLEYELYLPKLHDSEPEISFYHGRFSEGLERCGADCRLDIREEALRAA